MLLFVQYWQTVLRPYLLSDYYWHAVLLFHFLVHFPYSRNSRCSAHQVLPEIRPVPLMTSFLPHQLAESICYKYLHSHYNLCHYLLLHHYYPSQFCHISYTSLYFVSSLKELLLMIHSQSDILFQKVRMKKFAELHRPHLQEFYLV